MAGAHKEPARSILIDMGPGQLPVRHWFDVGNAYNEGRSSAEQGWTIEACPYVEGGVKWHEWRKGWSSLELAELRSA